MLPTSQFYKNQVVSDCSHWPKIYRERNSRWQSGLSILCSGKTGRIGPQTVKPFQERIFFFLIFLIFLIFISWRLITLQYCSGLCHTLTWISHGFTCIPILIPPSTSFSTWSLWVFPVHQARALVSCIQPGLVIYFTIDNIHVSVLFSWNIPPSLSPRVQNSVLYICVSSFVLHIGLSLPSF